MLVDERRGAKNSMPRIGPDLPMAGSAGNRDGGTGDIHGINNFDVKNCTYLSTGNVDSLPFWTIDACPDKGFSGLLKPQATYKYLILLNLFDLFGRAGQTSVMDLNPYPGYLSCPDLELSDDRVAIKLLNYRQSGHFFNFHIDCPSGGI